ncbi:MAG: hypothetical protein QM756_11785 [Polyangiaceae bacterium]
MSRITETTPLSAFQRGGVIQTQGLPPSDATKRRTGSTRSFGSGISNSFPPSVMITKSGLYLSTKRRMSPLPAQVGM